MWLQRDFLKEKLRVRERYWHPVLSLGCKDRSNVIVNETINCIIPDGLALYVKDVDSSLSCAVMIGTIVSHTLFLHLIPCQLVPIR